MKTIKRLNIENKRDYYFMNMTNINDFDPKLLLINEVTTFNCGSTMFELSYCEELNTPYIVFNDIECIFIKSGIKKYLVFCETEKNKKMLENYTKIIDEIKDQIFFITEDDVFVMGNDFTRFKFKTNDKLSYNKKINVSVCVISIGSVSEQGWYYPQTLLQDCFYEKVMMIILLKNKVC